MNLVQAIRLNEKRKAVEKLRKLIPRINRGFVDIRKLRQKLREEKP